MFEVKIQHVINQFNDYFYINLYHNKSEKHTKNVTNTEYSMALRKYIYIFVFEKTISIPWYTSIIRRLLLATEMLYISTFLEEK